MGLLPPFQVFEEVLKVPEMIIAQVRRPIQQGTEQALALVPRPVGFGLEPFLLRNEIIDALTEKPGDLLDLSKVQAPFAEL
jgi:hypothetical protein